ncbi:MAG: DNA recombination protein RmuC [Patescibacteria group bacterium]
MEQWVLLLVIIAGFAALYYLLSKQLQQQNKPEHLESLIDRVFGMSAQKITMQSKTVLEGERETIKTDLANKQLAIEKLVKQLQNDINERQEEIRSLERDRVKKFSEIVTALEGHSKLTDELKTSTQQLAAVLSNNQARGQWGERIIEDLMKANGLMEGVHYLRQNKLGSSELKPDITLILPNHRCVPVDVKFPYQEIQKMAMAEGKAAKSTHMKQFAVDLRSKINKVAAYISPENNTLDYAILFVPNEMVFSFINQEFSEIVDEAISKRVIVVSPFTFIIVARTVLESYRNFMIGDKLREVVKYVDEFVNEWTVFKGEFEKFGRSIDTLSNGYEKLTTTRAKQMERRIEKIEDYRQGVVSLGDGEKI